MSQYELEKMKDENDFIDSLLTPVTLVSGFLLAVTFYLVDLQVKRDPYHGYPSISLEVSVFVIFFCLSLVALDLIVSARIVNRIYFERLLSKGISRGEILTILGFIAFFFTTLGVSYLVPLMSYGLMGFIIEGRNIALLSLLGNIFAYILSIGIAIIPYRTK